MKLAKRILKMFGLKIVYMCDWGLYDTRYDSIDASMCRPIHPDMSVAPPWAKLKIAKEQPMTDTELTALAAENKRLRDLLSVMMHHHDLRNLPDLEVHRQARQALEHKEQP